jgi:hypothetical protein
MVSSPSELLCFSGTHTHTHTLTHTLILTLTLTLTLTHDDYSNVEGEMNPNDPLNTRWLALRENNDCNGKYKNYARCVKLAAEQAVSTACTAEAAVGVSTFGIATCTDAVSEVNIDLANDAYY